MDTAPLSHSNGGVGYRYMCLCLWCMVHCGRPVPSSHRIRFGSDRRCTSVTIPTYPERRTYASDTAVCIALSTASMCVATDTCRCVTRVLVCVFVASPHTAVPLRWTQQTRPTCNHRKKANRNHSNACQYLLNRRITPNGRSTRAHAHAHPHTIGTERSEASRCADERGRLPIASPIASLNAGSVS